MSEGVYGGDEISALVVDTGSYYTRFGFAGEDAPKVTLSTQFGKRLNPNYDPNDTTTTEATTNNDNTGDEDKVVFPNYINKKDQYLYYFDNDLHTPRPNTEVVEPIKDGIVSDWDAMQRLWDHGLNSCLNIDPTEHPLLMTENIWNTDENRTAMLEYAFESLQVPAFYIAKSPACSLFASGKGSGLIVDVGHDTASVTPVIDGLVLYKPSRRSRYAGKYLNRQIERMISSKDITITPRYLVGSKQPVGAGEPAIFTKRTVPEPIDSTFHQLEVDRVITEFKETMVQVRPGEQGPSSEGSGNSSSQDQTITARPFEFPDGYNASFESERCTVVESLFNPRENPLEGEELLDDDVAKGEKGDSKGDAKSGPEQVVDKSTSPFISTGISDMIIKCINACDVDIRANLANNIVITGGTSLVQGFTDRVNQDLSQALAGLKVRIYAPGNTTERRNSAWIGGSILGSLGTFHQLWISKKEYQEVGATKLLEKRFR
uniref:ARAD1D34012p n=1 Tax=Blastobotrys adeninivorans TaxID=409370 RepID=A0A060TBR0_BLAAD